MINTKNVSNIEVSNKTFEVLIYDEDESVHDLEIKKSIDGEIINSKMIGNMVLCFEAKFLSYIDRFRLEFSEEYFTKNASSRLIFILLKLKVFRSRKLLI